ncbi:Outer membrane lipoprotein-sorting protein [Methanophagales archaeon]|nr:Outer membrane lipoprotein-sorting protein [Methanophagales archaeon]
MVEKTKKWAIIIGIILVGVVLSAGCADKAEQEVAPAAPPAEATNTSTQSSTDETPAAPTSNESLIDLIGKAKGITVKYDMVTTDNGEIVSTSTAWLAGNNMRIDTTAEGQAMSMIVRGDDQVSYMYQPDENMALKTVLDEVPESVTGDVEALMDLNPTIIGTETIDGMRCTVIEYVVMEEPEELKMKQWIWIKNGLPVQMEMTLPSGISRREMRNFDFGSISDTTFELPAGVDIKDMSEIFNMSSLPEGA